MKACTGKMFLKDVAGHKMTVLLDQGVHRSIRFAAEGKNSYFNHFVLTTWPWHLCISGDMGTFVFNRLEDMFEFFRTPSDKPGLYINTGYWEEKCEASDRRTNGTRVYDADRFKECVMDRFKEHEFDNRKAKASCLEQLKEEVLYAENEYEAHTLASRFRFYANPADEFNRERHPDFELTDFWECELKEYTYHYVWCCYAIAWGIRQYDKAKEVKP